MSGFDESKYQRDNVGKFSSSGGEGKQTIATKGIPPSAVTRL